MGDGAPDLQQWAAPRRVVGAHSGDRAHAGSTAKAQQHRFRLVVERVAQQHRPLPVRAECGVTRGAGGRLGTALVAHVHSNDLCVNASQGEGLRVGGFGDGRRIGLQAVVHDQRGGGLQAGRHRGERQGIRSAGQRHPPSLEGGEMGLAERLDSRAQLPYSSLSIHRWGSSISIGKGSVSGPVQIALKRSIPTRPTTWSTNALPRVYWLSLASSPSRARSSRCSGGCLRWRGSSNRRGGGGPDGTTAGPTASITWSAWPSSSVPSTKS